MQKLAGARGMELDTRAISLAGLAILLTLILASLVLSSIGCLFLVSLLSITVYLSSNLAQRSRGIGNYFRGWVPPRTRWCSRMEYESILLPPDVDQALESLYERIIREHVSSWYTEAISSEEEFLQEVRLSLRHITAELLSRLTRTDLTELLMREVIPAGLAHLDSWLWARHHLANTADKSQPEATELVNTWLGFVGEGLHPALRAREAETRHLETISARLSPLVLGETNTCSKLGRSVATAILSNILLQAVIDLICEPRTINKLLLLWFSPEPVTVYPSCPEPPVKLLLGFVRNHSQPKPSCLHVDLSALLKNTELIYPFLQHLKKNGGVNYLHFCLAVETFNKKMMVVDLSEEDLKTLHASAKDLYDTYIKIGSPSFIKFDDDIVRDISEIISLGHTEIHKLRTSPPLFRAYEQVYNYLEDNLCPRFHTSEEYLQSVVGTRLINCRPDLRLKEDEYQKNKRDSWLSAINPLKILNLSHNEQNQKSVFYCSTQDMTEGDNSDMETGLTGPEETQTVTKSVSSSHLEAGVPDSGLGSSYKELSRSLDFLGDPGDGGPQGSDHSDQGQQRRKSQTLPTMPSMASPLLRQMSLGTAFGSKKLGLSRKLSSIITVPTERLGNKHIKGKLKKLKQEVLGGGTVEGALEQGEPVTDSVYDMADLCEDAEDTGESGETCRDLSAWRVSIPRLEPRNDSVTGKSYFVFMVQVQRIDVTSNKNEDLEWEVERQFQEFYSLQSALVQYHGVFDDIKLPSRSKLFGGGKGLDVLQSKLEPFQDFLVKLLQKPNLRKSDLLYSFLTTRAEFTESSTAGLFTRVPSIKLTKERGQFLQSFLSLYTGSTQNPPPRPGKLVTPSPSLTGAEAEDREGLVWCTQARLGPSNQVTVTGLYDGLLYVAARVCDLQDHWLRLLTSVRWLLADSVHHLVHYLIASKLDNLLTSGRVAHLISTIEESLFEPSKADLKDKKTEAETLAALRHYLPTQLRLVMGEERFERGTERLISGLQQHLMNKHLAFTLVEILIAKIFPEIKL